MIFLLLQYLCDKHVHLHEMDKEGFYLSIVLLSTTSNHLEKLKCFKCPLETINSGVAACVELSICLERASIQHI